MAPVETGKLALEIFLVPKEFPRGSKAQVKFQLTPQDFGLSWVEYFQKQDGDAFKMIVARKSAYTIMDRRPFPDKKIWSLDSTIRNFIDSFSRNLKTYRADLGKQKSNTQVPVSPKPLNFQGQIPTVGPSRENGATHHNPSEYLTSSKNPVPSSSSTAKKPVAQPAPNLRPSAEKRKSSGNCPPGNFAKRSNLENGVGGLHFKKRVSFVDHGRKQTDDTTRSRNEPQPHAGQGGGNMPRNFHRVRHIPIEREDDACSMASTVDSEASQLEQLNTEGIDNVQVKSNFVACVIKQVDNSSLLLMRNELKKLVETGSYCRVARRIPHTAYLLNIILHQLNQPSSN